MTSWEFQRHGLRVLVKFHTQIMANLIGRVIHTHKFLWKTWSSMRCMSEGLPKTHPVELVFQVCIFWHTNLIVLLCTFQGSRSWCIDIRTIYIRAQILSETWNVLVYNKTDDIFLPRSSGTYEGLVEKLDYLQSMGINCIELLPIQEFNELEYYEVFMTWTVTKSWNSIHSRLFAFASGWMLAVDHWCDYSPVTTSKVFWSCGDRGPPEARALE